MSHLVLKALFCWLCMFQLTCLKCVKSYLFLNTTPFPRQTLPVTWNSTAIPFFKKRNGSLVLLWQLKAAQVVWLHCFSSKYVSAHSREEKVWVPLGWICTQSFQTQNPFNCILSPAFLRPCANHSGHPSFQMGSKKISAEGMKSWDTGWSFWQTQKPLLERYMWLNTHYATGVSWPTTAWKTITSQRVAKLHS